MRVETITQAKGEAIVVIHVMDRAITRITAKLEGEADTFRERPLPSAYTRLYASHDLAVEAAHVLASETLSSAPSAALSLARMAA